MLQFSISNTLVRIRGTSENILDTALSGHSNISDTFIKWEGGYSAMQRCIGTGVVESWVFSEDKTIISTLLIRTNN